MDHAQATIVAKAVLDVCKRQVNKARSLDGINLESVIQRALVEHNDLSTHIGEDCAKVLHIQMQDVVGEYDTPDTVPEWAWVEAHASYRHRDNGKDGIWEFIVNLARHFDDVPENLRPVLENAKRDGIAYLVFHQGT